jgi:hypothetical protein
MKVGDKPVSKKRIIIAAVAVVSFAGSFVLAWLTKAAPQSQKTEVEQSTLASQETELKLPQPEAGTTSSIGASARKMKKAMTEKQLKNLIYEVREKNQEYNSRLRSVELREQRLQIAQNMLKKDIGKLNNLQIDLASVVSTLKNERDKLLKSRVGVAKAEKDNLISIAATYDKMDAASASKILTNMTQMQTGSGDSYLNDAVKILHYMSERTKAKLLAELVTSEPKLAAVLCRRLKEIIEEE